MSLLLCACHFCSEKLLSDAQQDFGNADNYWWKKEKGCKQVSLRRLFKQERNRHSMRESVRTEKRKIGKSLMAALQLKGMSICGDTNIDTTQVMER